MNRTAAAAIALLLIGLVLASVTLLFKLDLLFAVAAFLLLGAGGLMVLHLRNRVLAGPEAAAPPPVLTLRDHYETDFGDEPDQDWQMETPTGEVPMRSRLVRDGDAASCSLSFYLPASYESGRIAYVIAGRLDEFGADRAAAAQQLSFSRHVYLYHESDLALGEIGEIETAFHAADAEITFRGPGYAATTGFRHPAEPEPLQKIPPEN